MKPSDDPNFRHEARRDFYRSRQIWQRTPLPYEMIHKRDLASMGMREEQIEPGEWVMHEDVRPGMRAWCSLATHGRGPRPKRGRCLTPRMRARPPANPAQDLT